MDWISVLIFLLMLPMGWLLAEALKRRFPVLLPPPDRPGGFGWIHEGKKIGLEDFKRLKAEQGIGHHHLEPNLCRSVQGGIRCERPQGHDGRHVATVMIEGGFSSVLWGSR